MSWLSQWFAPLNVPVKGDVPPCEHCHHPARAHHDATSCSVRGFWGRRCRCSGYIKSDSADAAPLAS
jgi:hypothetical protein